MPNSSPPTDQANSRYNHPKVSPSFTRNRRMGIRYIRNDIGASIRKIGIFNFSFRPAQNTPVKLVDISSRGVLIGTKLKLPVYKHVILTLRFADFKEFQIRGKVVRRAEDYVLIYGVKFDRLNNDLADYLLSTQRKLIFR